MKGDEFGAADQRSHWQPELILGLVENLKYDVPNSGTLVAKSNDAGSASVAGDKLGRMHAA